MTVENIKQLTFASAFVIKTEK